MRTVRTVWIVLAGFAAFALLASDPALARAKRKAVVVRCHPAPARSGIGGLFETRAEPQPNGCAPAVYQYGKFVGQDPDARIRQQLLRDPATGYSTVNNN